MYCDEALDAVEAVAASELIPDGRLADHYTTCPNCASALARARAVERLLQQRPAPQAPANFTSRAMARVRRARWRSEQFVDAGFNIAIAVIVLAIVGGVWMLLNRSGMTAVSNDAFAVLTSGLGLVASRVAPSLPLYLGAVALLGTALGIWWWAEREV